MAQINVGAATETEMKERKFLLDDAQPATQAALEEGIVPGGGVALLRCEKAVDKLELDGDEALGAKIVRNVLDAPAAGDRRERRPGRRRGRQPRPQERKATKATTPISDEYCDLVEAGIIDPAKVVRTALQNAASVACLLLTTSCLVTEIPKEEGPTRPGRPGGMGGGMGGMGGMGRRHGRHGWHGRHG